MKDKAQIIKENRNLSGVYIFIHKESNKIYIGSSLNIGRRLYGYFSKYNLIKNKTMVICRALLKYGHSQFSLGILEYCNSIDRIERENYYINEFKPEYNVLTIAGLPPIYNKTNTIKRKMRLASRTAIKVSFKSLE